MPATPLLGLRYPAATDPADVPTDLQELATDVEAAFGGSRYRGALTPAQFAALTGVTDGDIADLVVDAAGGVVWRFRYRAASASAYKWEFLGGGSLSAFIATGEAVPGSGSYADLATPGPQVTTPRAGEYEVAVQADIVTTAPNSATLVGMTRGAAPADDATALWTAIVLASSPQTGAKAQTFTLATNDVVKLRYRGGAPSNQYANRRVRLTPIRIS